MAKAHREVVTQTFVGGRFDDHGLDLDVLPELTVYKAILVETARELWRQKNPERERLPANFEASLVLKVYEIRGGSVCVPICHEFDQDPQLTFLPDGDELNEAAELVTEVIRAAEHDQPVPEGFPATLLGRFKDYGKSLRDDESIEHRLPGAAHGARYTQAVRKRLGDLADHAYEDALDVVGTVTMARVSRPRMAIAIDGRDEVEAPFDRSEEDVITTALKEHATAKVRIRGRGSFLNGILQKIVKVDSVELLPGGELPFDETSRPIWEVFEQMMQGVAAEEISKLPADGAEQHDHYIYGVPKRDP